MIIANLDDLKGRRFPARRFTKNLVGIVGCGTISQIHAEVISRLENASLTSAFSRTPDRRNTFCNNYGITGYSDYDEFLAQKELDVVVLCTPNGTHLDYGMKAADAGKHLIIEKPIEITIKRARKLIEHCANKGVKLAVIYQNRFISDVQRMKKAINEGLIGEVTMTRASIKWYRDQSYYNEAPWRGSLELDGGGALINQGIHTVDLLYWLAGPIVSIQAFKDTLTHENIKGEDNLVASLKFANGALGTLEASTSIIPAQNRMIEVHGTKGTAILDGDEFRLYSADGSERSVDFDSQENTWSGSEQDSGKHTEQKGSKTASTGATSPMAGFKHSHHLAQYQSILDRLHRGVQPVVSGEESLKSLAIVEAAYVSANEERAVSVFNY
ncbi:Gfo/Idh/MocA family protein [Natronogracilivirga saccharolytica]|uniref:Gfo/Idh/MocA family oxidoreductase n=1 Tax=Natronogracilivirga saccharolytica TaxID=2812953 RepID=A0A8J7UWR7_9BACT|nr:Gfo/Idh/MocA family oxidoreductase [Natronogracilivirga saccharolytica]MBP3193966.1 Gfo/Idh/MocA family oxidoreductase [Natronogracilivirga saccharolytica]